MIKLESLDKPQILVDRAFDWTKDLMSYIKKGLVIPPNIKNKYRHPQVKENVKLETKEKCVYCESKITHQYPGDIEHIVPKSVYPRLTFYWKNLTFVCSICNNRKRDYVAKNEAKLLNPYVDYIEDHLRFFGPLMINLEGSKRGEITWKKIDLNRGELIDRRCDKLKDLQNLIDKYNRETIAELKEILLNEIIEFSDADKEYSYACNCFLLDQNIINAT